jgi:hypothetical protein
MLFVLAGCVAPVSVREQGTVFLYVPSNGPHRAAQCIVRNLKRHTPALVAEAVPGRNSQTWEVTVADGTGVLATARTDAMTIAVQILAQQPDNEKFANDLVGFC